MGSGSGAVIFHEPGDGAYILTANHVVDDCEEKGGRIYVRAKSTVQGAFGQPDWTGKTYFVSSIVAQDKKTDLAVLKTITRFPQQLSFLGISKDQPYLGQPIWIVGYPAPMADDLQINSGIVSALKQNTEIDNYYVRVLLIDAYCYFGNSGGPVVDEDMNITGVAVAIFGGFVTPKPFGKPFPPGPSRGMAVSSQEVWQFLKKDLRLKPLYDKIIAYEARELSPSPAPTQDASGNQTPSR